MKVGGLVGSVRVLFTSEKLTELPEPKGEIANKSFLSQLLAAETLPEDEPAPAGSQGMSLVRLFAAERLPVDEPTGPQGRRSLFLARLFARETLPADPAGANGPRGAHRRRNHRKCM